MMAMCKSKMNPLAFGLLSALTALPVWALEQPDAGQTLQQMRTLTTPPVQPPAAVPDLLLDETVARQADAGQGPRIDVKTIRVEGSTTFAANQLEELLEPLAGGAHSLAELEEGARTITRFYRSQGYLLARAYLPQQTISDGVVVIRVLEGALDQVVLNNRSQVPDADILGVLGDLHSGSMLQVDSLNRSLFLLRDTPGIRNAQAALRSGSAVGTSRLVVSTEAAPRYQGDVQLDNQGNRFTGEDRLTGHLQIDNLLRQRDRGDVRLTVGTGQLLYGRVAWDTAMGYNGVRVGAEASYSRYELGRSFSALDAHGDAQVVGLYGSYPLLLTMQRRLTLNAALQLHDLDDIVGVVNADTRKKSRTLALGATGDYSQPGQFYAWRADATFGKLDIDTPSALATDRVSARTNGNYGKLLCSFNGMSSVAADTLLALTASAQRANKNLDSSEKFSIGGPNGVRAYPSGEGLGDQGWLATLEVRQTLLPRFQGLLFYDAGRVSINHTPYVTTTANGKYLAGKGFGMAWNPWRRLNLKATAAWRTAAAPTSDKDRGGRVWAQASYAF